MYTQDLSHERTKPHVDDRLNDCRILYFSILDIRGNKQILFINYISVYV